MIIVGTVAACTTKTGVVMGFGHDISHTNAKNQDDCCSKCNAIAACACWTFDAPSTCYFHSACLPEKVETRVCVSGTRDGPMPPTPPPPPPTPGPTPASGCDSPACKALSATYTSLQNKTCGNVIENLPSIPSKDTDAFLKAYQAYDGNVSSNEQPVFDAATQLLTKDKVADFLSLPDSFAAGGLDDSLVRCAVLVEATADGLALFASNTTANKALVDHLLGDTMLMRDILIAGGANGGKYGEAMAIYTKLLNASKLLRLEARDKDELWDDRSQKNILRRLALGTAVEHAVPVKHQFPVPTTFVEPVARYLHYEHAYMAGDLDPEVEVMTGFECAHVTNSPAVDENLAWLRRTQANYRPDHIAKNGSNPGHGLGWRYSFAVHTEVNYQHPQWLSDPPDFTQIPAAGGECGPRAWFGRFTRWAWGLPIWGVKQKGHAALSTWSLYGWQMELGAAFPHSYWQGRSGPDFYLETQAREHRSEYQQVLRGQWVTKALGEEPCDPSWTPVSPGKGYGKGGVWSALMLYKKKMTVGGENATQANRTARHMGPSVVPTKVQRYVDKWAQKLPTPTITTGPDGTITIPATAFSKISNTTGEIIAMNSFDLDGEQLLHSKGNHPFPALSSFAYDITVGDAYTAYLSVNVSTWHVNQDLLVAVNSTPSTQLLAANSTPVSTQIVPVYYTVGEWNQTQPIELKLAKGKNTLTFTRESDRELAIKEIFLYKTKPVVPAPPSNHTPAPTPAPIPTSDYIQLGKGLSCQSQGIKEMDIVTCQTASSFFGYTYNAHLNRFGTNFYHGCFAVICGSVKGNSVFNTNTSAVADPTGTAVALCLRK